MLALYDYSTGDAYLQENCDILPDSMGELANTPCVLLILGEYRGMKGRIWREGWGEYEGKVGGREGVGEWRATYCRCSPLSFDHNSDIRSKIICVRTVNIAIWPEILRRYVLIADNPF